MRTPEWSNLEPGDRLRHVMTDRIYTVVEKVPRTSGGYRVLDDQGETITISKPKYYERADD